MQKCLRLVPQLQITNGHWVASVFPKFHYIGWRLPSGSDNWTAAAENFAFEVFFLSFKLEIFVIASKMYWWIPLDLTWTFSTSKNVYADYFHLPFA